MSYKFTCYTHRDENITQTQVYVVDQNVLYTYPYDNSNNLGHTVDGITGELQFGAPLNDFKRWVYRIGSIDADVQYSTDMPFVYTQEQDIYIWAQSYQTTPTLYEPYGKQISNKLQAEIYINGYNLMGGTYTINSPGSQSQSGRITSNYGKVVEFTFSSSGYKTLILTVSVGDEVITKIFYININEIVPTYTLVEEDIGTISSRYTKNVELSSKQLYRGSVTFANSGVATFYTTGDSDPYAWLTTTVDWDTDRGRPNSYLKRNEDGGDGYNFKITYEVSAGTVYYIWFKDSAGENEVGCSLCIELSQASVNLTPTNLQSKRGDQSLTFEWDGAEDASYFWVQLSHNNTLIESPTTKYRNITFDGLMYGERYNIKIQAFNDSGKTGGIIDEYITTAPARPEIISATQSDGVISVSWKLAGESNISDVYFTLYDSNEDQVGDTYTLTFSGKTSDSFEFPQVANGEYTIKASSVLRFDNGGIIWSVKDDGDDGSSNNGDYKYVLEHPITVFIVDRMALWSWSTANSNLTTAVQTQRAKKAIDKEEGYFVLDFSHLVWNDLVDKVKYVIDETGERWSTLGADGKTYLSYAETRMSESDKVLTADKFNALRFNIGSRIPTGISHKNPGDIVKGNYFIALTNCLNAWIFNTRIEEYQEIYDLVTYPMDKKYRNPNNTEKESGGYYYKYSQGKVKSISTKVSFKDVISRYNLNKPNNGWVFLTCNNNYSGSGPEFGIACVNSVRDTQGLNPGDWVVYTRPANSTEITFHKDKVVFSPTNMVAQGGIEDYEYSDTDDIILRATLDGKQFYGEIQYKGTSYGTYVDVGTTGINEAEDNAFLLGVSYVPHGQVYDFERDSYLKRVKLTESYTYTQKNYQGTYYNWVPDEGNPGTWYVLLVRPAFVTYERESQFKERIDISYE